MCLVCHGQICDLGSKEGKRGSRAEKYLHHMDRIKRETCKG